MRVRRASFLAITGGLAQIVAALTVLFLPVLGNCEASANGVLVCTRLSYIQYGGNPLGYGLLTLMIGLGVLAAGSARDVHHRRRLVIRWSSALLSVLVTIVTGWSFGIVFAPGALLLLIAAVGTGPAPRSDKQ